MADIAAVENQETPVIVVEKVPADEEMPTVEVAEAAEESSDEVSTTVQNGTAENGDCDAEAIVSEEAVAAIETSADDATEAVEESEESVVPAEEAAVAENGDGKEAVAIAEEANGDATDTATIPTAEALKRKVAANAGDEKIDENAATPEKKAKLDEISKDELQNGSDASEVAA